MPYFPFFRESGGKILKLQFVHEIHEQHEQNQEAYNRHNVTQWVNCQMRVTYCRIRVFRGQLIF